MLFVDGIIVLYKNIILLFVLGLFLGTSALAQSTPEELLNADNYFLLGAAKYKCNACEHSLQDFTKAIDIRRDYAEAFYGRSLSYICLEKYDLALVDARSASRLNSTEVLYRELQGRIKSLAGDQKGAIREFNAALKMDALCWQAWYGLAMEAYQQKKFNDAEAQFDEAIRLNPDFTMAYVNKGKLLVDLAQYPAALAHLGRAIELEPGYAVPYEYASLARLKLEDYSAAVEMADSALVRDPEMTTPLLYLGEAYFALKQYNLADDNFALYLKKNKDYAPSWFRRGQIHGLTSDQSGALKYYSKAIKKDPTATNYYIVRGILETKMEKHKGAIKDFTKAITLDKHDLSLYLKRGFSYLAEEDIPKAMADFKFVSDLEPSNGTALYGTGNALYLNGQVRMACNHWKQAIQHGEGRAGDQLNKYCSE